MTAPSSPSRSAPRFLFALVAAFLALMMATKSSFLYPLNDWVDVNCFFTVGRGILHGLMPYRDLYEQKGPLTYLLFALAAGISEESFLGVFMLECLCFGAFLFLSGKIAETLSGRSAAFWPTVALLAVCVPLSPAFSHGASAEEFFLPVLALGLWIVLEAMEKNAPLKDSQGVILGLCAAGALWMKYTFCGLFLGLAVSVILWYIRDGFLRNLPRLMGFFLLGAAALSGLIIGWFAARGALRALWQVYFVDNLTAYSHNIRSGNYDPPLENLLNNLSWSIPSALGLLWLLFTGKKRWRQAAAVWLAAVGLFVFTYLSGRRYPYYALVLSVFAPVGLGALGRLPLPLIRKRPALFRRLSIGAAAILVAASPFLARHFSGNAYLLDVKKEDTPQFRFASVIREAEDSTLLNYGFLDGGFYFAASSLPSSPYFCTLNIDSPEMSAALDRAVREGQTAFVVTRDKKLRNSRRYRLVDEASLRFEGRVRHYYLYQRLDEEA